MRFPFISAICIFIVFLVIAVASCNKDEIKTTTRVKCVTCANGGSCINDTCRCPTGYEGTACQTQTRQKYLGSWTVREKGSTSSSFTQYSLSIQTNSSNPAVNSVSLYNLYYYGFSSFLLLNAFITSDSIFIPRQQVDSKYIIGKGYFFGSSSFGTSTITMRYKVTDTATGITNDFGYSSAVDSPSVWTR